MTTDPWERKLGFFYLVLAIVFALAMASMDDAHGRTLTFQAKESTATVNNPSKCPGKPVFTVSQSIWNQGGWPLFRITCYYGREK